MEVNPTDTRGTCPGPEAERHVCVCTLLKLEIQKVDVETDPKMNPKHSVSKSFHLRVALFCFCLAQESFRLSNLANNMNINIAGYMITPQDCVIY